MPSEVRGRDPWIASQGLGIICAQATVLLLAVGSLVLAATKDGVSADIRMDDIRPFFEPMSPWHAWFYALLAVLSLYAVNTAWCTTLSVTRRWRAGQRHAGAYAAALMHVGFLVGLVAHLVGGLGGQELGQVALDDQLRPLGPGLGDAQARLVSLEQDQHPDGSPKRVFARVEVHDDGDVQIRPLAFNRPLTRGQGSQLMLLQDYGTSAVAVLSDGVERCVAGAGQRCRLSGVDQSVRRVLAGGGHWGPEAVAVLASGDFLVEGRPTRVGGGPTWTLLGIEQRSTVVLRARY